MRSYRSRDGDSIQRQNRHGAGRLRRSGVPGNRAADGRRRECLVEPVGLRGVGDGGQLGVRRVGVARGDHGRRGGIDVEGLSGQRVCRIDQDQRRGPNDPHRVRDNTDGSNGCNPRRGTIHRATEPIADDITRAK